MNTLRIPFLLSLAVAMAPGVASADPVSLLAAPSGLRDTTLKALSDTILAPAYTRAPAYVGKVAVATAGSLAVSGSPGWSSTRFVYAAGTQPNHYYALLGAGPSGTPNPLEGLVCDIASNDSGTLYLNTGDNLTTVPAGTTVTIIPHWTLAKLFPASDAGISFAVTTSTQASKRKTQIILPDPAATGINPPAAGAYYFYNNAWRKVGEPVTVAYDDTVTPDSGYITVRNNGSTDLRLRLTGTVATGKLTRQVDTLPAAQQDNLFSTGRPVPVSLLNSGLVASGAFVTSPSSSSVTDRLLVFDNTVSGYNKTASATYYHCNGAWRKVGASDSLSFDDDAFAPDAGFVVRKAPASGSPDWTGAPAYPIQ